MQLYTANYSSYPTTSAGKTSSAAGKNASSDFASLADYDSRQNTIFQNLLKNPNVADNVTLNEDGSYSFTMEKTPLTNEETIMRLLINEQNSDFYEEGQMTPYSVSELAMFRQMTGYNLIQAGGLYTVVDDYGSPVPPEDRAMTQAAWDMFDLAKCQKDWTAPGAEITIADLKAAGELQFNAFGADTDLYQSLLDLVGQLAEDQIV